MNSDILYVASQSKARHQLLEYAKIPHKILAHTSDEHVENFYHSFADYVLAIARSKMESVTLPHPNEIGTEYVFVLTADTLIRNPRDGSIFGKPIDRAHAVHMLAQECEQAVEVITGCCLEKFIYRDNKWVRDVSEHWTTSALVEFYVDADSVDSYLSHLPVALQCSGAGVVEDHGLSYLKSINGSYTAVIGLPLYELRQALKKIGFNL